MRNKSVESLDRTMEIINTDDRDQWRELVAEK